MDVLLNNENIFQMVIVTKGLAERDVVRSKLEKAFEQDFADFTTRVMPLELGPPVGWHLSIVSLVLTLAKFEKLPCNWLTLLPRVPILAT